MHKLDEFLVQTGLGDDTLLHFGVKGMRWGVRRALGNIGAGIKRGAAEHRAYNDKARATNKTSKAAMKLRIKGKIGNSKLGKLGSQIKNAAAESNAYNKAARDKSRAQRAIMKAKKAQSPEGIAKAARKAKNREALKEAFSELGKGFAEGTIRETNRRQMKEKMGGKDDWGTNMAARIGGEMKTQNTLKELGWDKKKKR